MKKCLHARLAPCNLQIWSCWFAFFVSRETFLRGICSYSDLFNGYFWTSAGVARDFGKKTGENEAFFDCFTWNNAAFVRFIVNLLLWAFYSVNVTGDYLIVLAQTKLLCVFLFVSRETNLLVRTTGFKTTRLGWFFVPTKRFSIKTCAFCVIFGLIWVVLVLYMA